MQWTHEGQYVTDENSMMDVNSIHDFLSNHSYWAKGRTKEAVTDSIKNSLCLGVFKDKAQVGFARVITDYTTFSYLCDVYVLENFRNHGIGTFLLNCALKHPQLTGTNWILKTTFSQTLYSKLGFSSFQSVEGWMRKGSCCD